MLADNPPDQEVKHVLYTHDAANKVVFLQGSAFSKQVGGRSACLCVCHVFQLTACCL